MSKPLRCCSCNKVIAEEISIQAGVVKITCKCGTVNEVKAEPKQSVPYGERVDISFKTHLDSTINKIWGGTPLNTSKNAKG